MTENCNTGVEELRVKLEYFKNNLESFSLAAKTVEASKYRSQDETTVYSKIEDGLRGSKETCKTHHDFYHFSTSPCSLHTCSGRSFYSLGRGSTARNPFKY